MTRGGYREGAGRKSSWNNPETQLIRIPKLFAGELLRIARRLDRGEPIGSMAIQEGIDSDSVTESYSQDTLHQVAQEIIADDAIAPTPNEKNIVQRALNEFITRLVQ